MWSTPKTIHVLKHELNLDVVLCCGQAFRWKLDEDKREWISTLKGRVFGLQQTEEGIQYRVWNGDDAENSENNGTNGTYKHESAEAILTNYFQLGVRLQNLVEEWKKDPLFENVHIYGVRTLRQQPFECLMSFIISSCNNIKRISSMVDHLSSYGPLLATINGTEYHDFPTVESLSSIGPELESKLRTASFGYRATYVAKVVDILKKKGSDDWLNSLREAPYEEARDRLMELPGVGRKVADCVCLMALDKPQAVPIDTHVFQIAKANMDQLKDVKNISPAVYPVIVEWFRERFGPWCGWAQGVLFANKIRLPEIRPLKLGKLESASETKITKPAKKQKIEAV